MENLVTFEKDNKVWYRVTDIERVLGFKKVRSQVNKLFKGDDNRMIMITTKELKGINNRGENFLDKKAVQILANQSKKNFSKEVIEYFELNEKYKPKMVTFENALKEEIDLMIKGILQDDWSGYTFDMEKMLRYEEQYNINGYKVDFAFLKAGLLVEYDEEHHNTQSNSIKDKQREIEILAQLEMQLDPVEGATLQDYIDTINDSGSLFEFIRIKKGEEKLGIYKLMTRLFHINFIC